MTASLGVATTTAPADDVLSAHGHIAGGDALAVYRRTVRDVIVPGFEGVGIDVTEIRSLAPQRRWIDEPVFRLVIAARNRYRVRTSMPSHTIRPA